MDNLIRRGAQPIRIVRPPVDRRANWLDRMQDSPSGGLRAFPRRRINHFKEMFAQRFGRVAGRGANPSDRGANPSNTTANTPALAPAPMPIGLPPAPPAGFGRAGGGLPQAGGGITMENLADVRSRLRSVANPEGSAYSRGETPGIGGKYGIRPEDLQAAKSRLRPMVGVNGVGNMETPSSG
jgi:hypothetical protein